MCSSDLTFRWINKEGEAHWVKLHFRTKSGVKNLTADKATELQTDPDYAVRDLVSHIDSGKTAEWDLFIQAIPEKDGFSYKWNIFDVTKVVSQKDYPLIPIFLFAAKVSANIFAFTVVLLPTPTKTPG